MAATDTQTRKGMCPSHGAVDATREVPHVGFPFFYHGIRRLLASRKPFTCPACGAPVKPV